MSGIRVSKMLSGIRCFTLSDNADVSTDSYLTTQEDYLDPVFRCGWAKRPKVGQMYGIKYVEDYRSDIKSLYNSGEADKKNKKSPAQMLEILESRILPAILK